ncbi:MAG: hypothetical protein JOZ93_02625 [Sinobacteraceae bacterium]|nr:hypothetical protein [Nevskiaceae bacterium]
MATGYRRERSSLRGLSLVRRGAAVAALVVGFVATASAEPPHGGHQMREAPGAGWDHMDSRFNHNHYYPGRGYVAHDLPRDRVIINGPRGRYFYSGGVWYNWGPRGYVVVGAPIGLFVPVLPPYYTTVWVAGTPYYYANDTYYQWRESDGQYEVVAPPDEEAASTDAPPPPPSAQDDVFVYPKSGQSEEQQAQDKYECHKWAQGESAFDPTQVNGGVAPELAGSKRAEYQRALGACLEGRGYSVK